MTTTAADDSCGLRLINHLVIPLRHMTRKATCLLLSTFNVAILLVIVEAIGTITKLLGLSESFDCRLCLRLCHVHISFEVIIDVSCVVIIFCEEATCGDDWLFVDWLFIVIKLLFLRDCCLAAIAASK